MVGKKCVVAKEPSGLIIEKAGFIMLQKSQITTIRFLVVLTFF